MRTLPSVSIAVVGLAVLVMMIGCAGPKAEPEYRKVRETSTETHAGVTVSNPALFEKAGDTNHVYMQELGGTDFIRLPR